jgi:diguanylate cyclase (GGDEF)-like protein
MSQNQNPRAGLSIPLQIEPRAGEALQAESYSARPVPVSAGPAVLTALTPAQLSKARLFSGLPHCELEGLLAQCSLKNLDQNGILIRPGETEDAVYVLLSGNLRIHLSTIDNDPIATVNPGESVGELSVIDSSPRSAYVIASAPSRLLEIKRDVFWRLADTCPTLPVNLLHSLARRLRENNTTIYESKRLQQEYKLHASVDGLTGLYNRRWLDEVLPRQVNRSLTQNAPTSLIMLDVDHFKRFNDEHGHQAGDFVLFAVARVLRTCFRPTDLIARYGGEEFTIILPDTPASGAIVAADRVRLSMADAHWVMPDQRELPTITVSMGVAELQTSDTAHKLVERADAALYQAKMGGRNRVCPAP